MSRFRFMFCGPVEASSTRPRLNWKIELYIYIERERTRREREREEIVRERRKSV